MLRPATSTQKIQAASIKDRLKIKRRRTKSTLGTEETMNLRTQQFFATYFDEHPLSKNDLAMMEKEKKRKTSNPSKKTHANRKKNLFEYVNTA